LKQLTQSWEADLKRGLYATVNAPGFPIGAGVAWPAIGADLLFSAGNELIVNQQNPLQVVVRYRAEEVFLELATWSDGRRVSRCGCGFIPRLLAQ